MGTFTDDRTWLGSTSLLVILPDKSQRTNCNDLLNSMFVQKLGLRVVVSLWFVLEDRKIDV